MNQTNYLCPFDTYKVLCSAKCWKKAGIPPTHTHTNVISLGTKRSHSITHHLEGESVPMATSFPKPGGINTKLRHTYTKHTSRISFTPCLRAYSLGGKKIFLCPAVKVKIIKWNAYKGMHTPKHTRALLLDPSAPWGLMTKPIILILFSEIWSILQQYRFSHYLVKNIFKQKRKN